MAATLKLPRDPWKALLAVLLLALATGNGATLLQRQDPPPCSELTGRVVALERGNDAILSRLDKLSERMDTILLALGQSNH